MPPKTATMADISHWEANQGAKSADSTNVYRGSQSLKLDNGGSGSLRANLRIGNEFSESWDLTDLRLDFAMRIDAATDQNFDITVRFYDTSGNTLNFKRNVDTSTESEWVRVAPSVNSESGAVDISAVDIIQINIDQSPDDSLVMNLDDMRFVETPDQGYVVMGFDDAFDDTYSAAYQTMADYGQVGYVAVPPDKVGTSGFATWSELREMYDDGWAFLNHTIDHSRRHGDNLSDEEAREKVERGKLDLLAPPDGGDPLVNGQSGFVYVAGEYDAGYKDIVDDYHAYAFGTQGATRCGTNGVQMDPMHIPRGEPSGSGDLDNLIGTNDGADTGVLDLVADYNQVAQLYFHRIGDSGLNSLTESDFDRLCEYIANKDGLDVIGFNEWVRRFGQPTW